MRERHQSQSRLWTDYSSESILGYVLAAFVFPIIGFVAAVTVTFYEPFQQLLWYHDAPPMDFAHLELFGCN
jgi:hypothetical protein